MITIFSGALIYAAKNAWKYWKLKDGANSTRLLFILAFICFIIHYTRILLGVTVGYFSAAGGLCFVIIYAQEDLKILWNNVRSKFKN